MFERHSLKIDGYSAIDISLQTPKIEVIPTSVPICRVSCVKSRVSWVKSWVKSWVIICAKSAFFTKILFLFLIFFFVLFPFIR